MHSLISKLKRRRTSPSEGDEPGGGGGGGGAVFALQRVPEHKKRRDRRRAAGVQGLGGAAEEGRGRPDELDGAEEPVAWPKAPPSIVLTTPDGRRVAAATSELMDGFFGDCESDEWDTEDGEEDEDGDEDTPPPLFWEAPKALARRCTARGPPAPVPNRQEENHAPFALDTFVLGPPDEHAAASGDSASHPSAVVSPFTAAPRDVFAGAAEEASSWWSWSSLSSSSSSSSSLSSGRSSSDSDSESDDTTTHCPPLHHSPYHNRHARPTDSQQQLQQQPVGGAGKPLYTPLLSADDDDDAAAATALVSFPALLSPEMQTFLAELDPDDMRDAEELLLLSHDGDDDDDGGGGGGGGELTRAGASEWAAGAAVSRPVPRWLWLRSTNSFPVFRVSAGPADLRHGGSKLRLAESVVEDGMEAE